MKNADMPAMPAGTVAMDVGGRGGSLIMKNVERNGLTKREHFAAMAMQGLITLKGSDCLDTEITTKQCVRMADALLKALED